MATAASISNASGWMPEDDVLLKNAMQEGASFEALVKGVVPFSRRFTLQELQDRWHSLLYDSDVAAQSSVSMFELELSGFNPVFKTEQSRSFNFKEVLGKRNRGSVRQHYYTMRKKFRRDPFSPTDLGFLEVANLHDSSGSKADFHVRKEESHDGKDMLRNCNEDHFKLLQEEDIEILRRAFPKHRDVSVTQGAAAAHSSYLTECSDTAEDECLNEVMRKDGFPADICTSKDVRIFEPSRKPSGVSTFIQRSSVTDAGGSVEHQRLSSEGKNFQSLNVQPPSAFDSTKGNCPNGFLGLQQGETLNSPNGNSFHPLGFPSPQPSLPLWEPADEFSAAALPEKLKHVDTVPGSRDCMVKDSLVYNVVHTEPLSDVSHDGLALETNSSVVAEGEDISDSLLNFSNEDDLLLLDVDKKDTFPKSSSDNLNSLLISHPNDIPEDGVYKRENEIMVSETGTPDHGSAAGKRLGAPASFIYDELRNLHEPAVKGSSGLVTKVDHHAMIHGNICCVLNTEDPEIPCNDDIFLLIHPSTSFASSAAPPQPISRGPVNVSSAAKQKQNVQGINLVTKGKDIARDSAWPKKVVPIIMPEAHLAKPIHFGIKSDCPDTGTPPLVPLPGDAKKVLADPAQSRPLLANPSISTCRVLNEDLPRVETKAGDNLAAFVEPQTAEAGVINRLLPDLIMKASTSDHEESQSDDDVPSYSDIEAMILELDLVPFDLDINNTKQVTRYQHEDTNRTIIRLEQCSQSCLQRVMTRQGAFAILYGRHLRHYIRKTEVTLGRSTDDVDVDIDIRKEGCANKISRRQAIIKMEGDGSFSLKNLGKSLISVNGKCIGTGQLLGLSSSCLIEMRGMSFVFEINHKYVSRYTSALLQRNKGRLSKFEWSQEQYM